MNNEEEELRSKGYRFHATPVGSLVTIHSVPGRENLPITRRYDISLHAKGFIRSTPSAEPTSIAEHEVQIFILDSYPYANDLSKLGAPFRPVWLSAIFHPNIAQGLGAGGSGIVCWRLLKDWTPLDTLYGIVKGLELLVEHPNTKDVLNLEECRAAAKWFDMHLEVLKK